MGLPDMMLAAYLTELGGPEGIRIGHLPVPVPGPTDVLVRTALMAVNHVDTFVRSGGYRTQTPIPFVIGRDLVGTVVRTGEGVDDLAIGAKVWCNSLGHQGRQGSFAEFAVVPRERLYRLPAQADPATAVSVLHTAATAYLGLFRTGSLRPGETVLVAGAAGGVGSAAVQLAVAAGARVIATAVPEDFDWCRRCGADVLIDYRDQALPALLAEAAPEGFDLWWDNSGRHDLDLAVPLLKRGGRIIALAGMAARPVLPMGALYTRDASIRGFVISNASAADLAEAAAVVNDLLATNRLISRINGTYPLTAAAEAHRQMEAGVKGRILVASDPDPG
ncbi:NADPH:quinone reductase [Micromonospora sp. WMMD558]|uniref:NADPH:quinone reductase n=1 Tax=Micromonospora sp. WMMD558 TaxID=3403462 RepID=UPI003BF52FCE